jgi:RNA polymerase sigma-70 factor (ECF subfamily)
MDSEPDFGEERALRSAVLRGDGHAWRVLYERHYAEVYAFADFRTGHCRDRTDEAVGEAWLVAVRRIRSFDPERGSFSCWLKGIVENVIRNQRRAERRAAGTGGERGGAREDRAAARLELAEQSGMCLTALPDRFQSVLRAKYLERLPVAEIARRWGESAKAVESLLARARAAFRQAYVRLDERS